MHRIENCPSLISLDIRANLISELSDLKALESLPSLEVLSLSDKNNKKANPVCPKYAKNARLLRFNESLKVLDGIEIHLWTVYNDLEDIQTPKFDLLVKKFRPQPIPAENIFNSCSPERVLLNITKTGGLMPHTNVEIVKSSVPSEVEFIATPSAPSPSLSLSPSPSFTVPPPLPSLRDSSILPVESRNPWTDINLGHGRNLTRISTLSLSDVPPESCDCECQTERDVIQQQEISLRLLGSLSLSLSLYLSIYLSLSFPPCPSL